MSCFFLAFTFLLSRSLLLALPSVKRLLAYTCHQPSLSFPLLLGTLEKTIILASSSLSSLVCSLSLPLRRSLILSFVSLCSARRHTRGLFSFFFSLRPSLRPTIFFRLASFLSSDPTTYWTSIFTSPPSLPKISTSFLPSSFPPSKRRSARKGGFFSKSFTPSS